jgi:putative ABC transport system permease protein
MRITDLVLMSIKQVSRLRRRYRSAVIGTALGTAGLITVMTVGDSVEENLGRNLGILGSATTVKATIDYSQFRYEDIEDVRKLPGVLEAAPAVFHDIQMVSHGKKLKIGVRLAGVEASMFRAVYLPIAEGRALSNEDVENKRAVCVIGETVRKTLFEDSESPLGKTVDILGFSFQVVGVLAQAEDPLFGETILLPINLGRSRIPDMFPIRKLYIVPKNWYLVEDVHKRVSALLTGKQPRYGHTITFEEDRIDVMKRTVDTFKFFLYTAISVTLILGGLGVTNVMLALVKERTTEIGLRKAVGATDNAIASQFLCESLLVSFMSSIIGIIVGSFAVEIITMSMIRSSFAYGVFLESVGAAVVIGIVVGAVSGVVPAKAAGRLDPVVAMRFE